MLRCRPEQIFDNLIKSDWDRVSALALLVLRVGADHHDPTVATDHPALVAHFLD